MNNLIDYKDKYERMKGFVIGRTWSFKQLRIFGKLDEWYSQDQKNKRIQKYKRKHKKPF